MADDNYGFPGVHKLGSFLFGGKQRMEAEAFEQGRLRTAQTETALENARMKRLERTSAEAIERELQGLEQAYADAGLPNPALHAKIARIGRGNTQQISAGLLNAQEFNNRDILGDPDASPVDQFAAGQGVQGNALSPLEMVGAGNFIDLEDVNPELQTTPLGETMMAENEATAALSNDRRLNPQRYRDGGAGGQPVGPFGKPPSGFVDNPQFDPTKLVGPDNPAFIDAKGANMGAIESRYLNRVQVGANNAVQTIENITQLPVGTSAGVMGVGAAPGESAFTASLDTLRNAVADQEVQVYNTMLAGLDRNLATVEGAGQIASDAFSASYGNLQLREGDSGFTKLHKMAEMAQTVTAGLEPYLHNPRVPAVQKQYMQDIINRVKAVIPFSHEDVTALEQGTNPQTTLRDLIKSKGLDLDQAQKPPAPQPGQSEGPDANAAGSDADIPAAVVENGGGQYDAQGKVVDSRGWILRSSKNPDGSRDWAFVNPQNPAEWEPVAQ